MGGGINFVKVARLQSEFCAKHFFGATKFLMKHAPKFSPKFLSLYCVGQKKSCKIPTKFPCDKSKNIHRRASAGAQGENFGLVSSSACSHSHVPADSRGLGHTICKPEEAEQTCESLQTAALRVWWQEHAAEALTIEVVLRPSICEQRHLYANKAKIASSCAPYRIQNPSEPQNTPRNTPRTPSRNQNTKKIRKMYKNRRFSYFFS